MFVKGSANNLLVNHGDSRPVKLVAAETSWKVRVGEGYVAKRKAYPEHKLAHLLTREFANDLVGAHTGGEIP